MTQRTAINPSTWSAALGFDQGLLVHGTTRTLYVSGQTATDGDGRPQHDGDAAAQLALSLDNVEAVLRGADMTLADVVRLTVYATDVDAVLAAYGTLVGRLAAAGATPPTTLLGVTRLALPGQVVELEATAAA